MYGASKLGRGGGRAGVVNKRNSFPPPPPHRLSTPSSSNRLSLGSSAARSRMGGPGSGASAGGSKAVEETFSLVSGNNPLAFAMIIRLAPDLVEEIKKVEIQGGAARIKFDSSGHNPNGNVSNLFIYFCLIQVNLILFLWLMEESCHGYLSLVILATCVM